MRSVHSADLKHLAFLDGFGLTRISAPNKVKTERKVSAGLDATLSLNAARTELLAWRENWDAMHHLAFPAMKALTKIDRFRLARTALAPDGGFVDITTVHGPDAVAELRRFVDPHTPPTSVTLPRRDAPVRPGVTLDGARPAWRPLRLVTAPSGVWAALLGNEATLLVGDFSVPAGRLRWSTTVRVPREALVTLHPFDDGRVVVAVFVPSRRESTLVRFDATGNTLGVHTLPSLCPAVPVRHDEVLHQLSPETVARTPLDGGVARTTGIARDDQGVGRVFGDGDAGYFLPWHAESVLDLRTADAVSRKLADDDAPVRRWFRAHLARANALGNPGGILFELKSFDANPARRDFGFSFDATPGDGSLRGALAAGMLTAITDDDALRNLHGWHWSVGGGVSPTLDADRWDDAEVDAAFAALEDAGVPLLECLKCLGDAYAFSYTSPAPQRVSFTLDGARRFLAGLTWALSHRGADGVREASRELAPALTAPQVAAALQDLPNDRGPRVDYHVLDQLAALSAHVFRHELPTIVAGLCRVPDAWRNGVGPRLEGLVKWLKSEAAEPDLFATLLARESGARGEIDFYVRRGLT
ncbi:MAG: hypothetical protein U0325_23490 [Polyangiales bacterium]